jgi:hypothetical protein
MYRPFIIRQFSKDRIVVFYLQKGSDNSALPTKCKMRTAMVHRKNSKLI